ncbi:MAG TPA: NAD(P)-dependent oxidoreductase [Gemmatimonadaceae bacterium]|nr:NAD(P)-dependent oxidoreductase [Gemmatimonadaceae bacterium]
MVQRRVMPAMPASGPAGDPAPNTEDDLDRRLAEPTPAVLDALRPLGGDLVVLGAGGKMGPTLARMARRALDLLGRRDRVIAVSRFASPGADAALRMGHVETIRCDLSDHAAVRALPEAPLVVFMAGQKFGTTDAPGATWMMNTVVPAYVAERYAGARIIAFSTGNVYPLTPAAGGGAREDLPPAPVGEYAASCLGRERVLEFASRRDGTTMAIVRLNYAVELRYGVLVDIVRAVLRGDPIDVRMGYVNVIWQGDANARALQCFAHAASPPFVINITGGETLSVRDLAEHAGRLLGRTPRIEGDEAPDALLSDASRSIALFGPPAVSVGQMMAWIADWLQRGGRVLDKPTHFEERRGAF